MIEHASCKVNGGYCASQQGGCKVLEKAVRYPVEQARCLPVQRIFNGLSLGFGIPSGESGDIAVTLRLVEFAGCDGGRKGRHGLGGAAREPCRAGWSVLRTKRYSVSKSRRPALRAKRYGASKACGRDTRCRVVTVPGCTGSNRRGGSKPVLDSAAAPVATAPVTARVQTLRTAVPATTAPATSLNRTVRACGAKHG